VSAHSQAPVFFLVPDGVDDRERVSGGNVYDQRIRDGLAADGWDARIIPAADDGLGQTARALSQLPNGALVLVDGLLLAREPEAIIDSGARLRLVVLAHMVAPGLDDRERAAFRAAQRVIATSGWTRTELVAQDAADPHRIVVAHPGTDPAPATTASETGGRLLCVGAVTPLKGHDLLVRALTDLTHLEGWSCTIVGSLATAPDWVAGLRAEVAAAALAERIEFAGVLTGGALEDAYGRADLVVMPSRLESYGMVVAEALARGIPVLATDVGGISEAIAGSPAGLIVPPDDPWALSVVLRDWWTNPARRSELKAAALKARDAARPWSTTTAIVEAALADTAREADAFGEDVPAEHARAGAATTP
jgi:glycosyltransferase involved in cell wall biosynthesis